MIQDQISPRRAQTRERLLDAALSIFADRGVAGSSVEEVCDAAGFSRGAFYSNFASKDELLLAAFRRMANRNLAAAQEVFNALPGDTVKSGDLDTVIRQAVDIVIAQGTDDTSVLVRTEVRLVAMRQPVLRAALYALESELMATFADLLETALARYDLRFTVDAATAIRWMSAVFDYEVCEAILQGRRGGPDFNSGLADLIQRLIAPATGPGLGHQKSAGFTELLP